MCAYSIEGAQHDVFTDANGRTGVTDLTRFPVQSPQEVWQHVVTGWSRRAESATDVHEHSSRSHCIIAITVMREDLMGHRANSSATLNIVDLAGSECAADSGGLLNFDDKDMDWIAWTSSRKYLIMPRFHPIVFSEWGCSE